MPPTRPFFDATTGDVDTDWVLHEAIPIAKLVLIFGAIAAVFFWLAFASGGYGSLLFAVVGQFVVAVGTGVVLLYVIVRARQLGDELDERERRE